MNIFGLIQKEIMYHRAALKDFAFNKLYHGAIIRDFSFNDFMYHGADHKGFSPLMKMIIKGKIPTDELLGASY